MVGGFKSTEEAFNEAYNRQQEQKARQDNALMVQKNEAVRDHVASLLKDGKCDQAIGYALENSDISLAREVREFCK